MVGRMICTFENSESNAYHFSLIFIKIKRNSSHRIGYLHLVKLDLRLRHFENTGEFLIPTWNFAHLYLVGGVHC